MASPSSQGNVKWVEGLRGITSFLVITTHIARAWDYRLFWPKDAIDAPSPRLLQLPIIRVAFQGRVGVPIFAFLTGFVCAYKPLKLAYLQGNALASLQSVARSAFRRPPRLVLPAAMATFMSFVLTLFGGYRTATRCDSFWVRFDAPNQEPTFAKEVRRLFRALLTTWTDTDNPYDRHQWAMRPLLIGAFQVYVCLAATLRMRFRYRILVHVLLMVYWMLNNNELAETFGPNIALGTLLAELSLHRPTQAFIATRHRLLSLITAPLLILVGLSIGSYPQEHEDWSAWSMQLHRLFVDSILIPPGSAIIRRFSTIAVQMCAIAIFLSPSLQEILSHRFFMWLGHHSFAVYLVHGTILRTVGMWIVYGISGEPWTPAGTNEDGSPKEQEWLPSRGRGYITLAISVFIALTYTAAWAWMRWVDSACARATAWLERKAFEDENKDGLAEKGLANGHRHTHRIGPSVERPLGNGPEQQRPRSRT